MAELHDLTALEQAAAVRRREVSPVELVEHHLDRVQRRNAELGAFVTVTDEAAREQAKQAEQRVGAEDPATLPPLFGVPTAIKDLNLTAGVRTTLGSALYADFVPPVDDHVVELLPRRRHDQPRQDQHAGVRAALLHRERRRPAGAHALGPEPLGRRLERRRGRRGGGRDGAVRAGQRRRRLDPDPGQRLRPGRDQGRPRPDQQRPGRRRPDRAGLERPARPLRPGRGGAAGRDGGADARRPALGAAAVRRARRSCRTPGATPAGCGSAGGRRRSSPTSRCTRTAWPRTRRRPAALAELGHEVDRPRPAVPAGRGRRVRDRLGGRRPGPRRSTRPAKTSCSR